MPVEYIKEPAAPSTTKAPRRRETDSLAITVVSIGSTVKTGQKASRKIAYMQESLKEFAVVHEPKKEIPTLSQKIITLLDKQVDNPLPRILKNISKLLLNIGYKRGNSNDT